MVKYTIVAICVFLAACTRDIDPTPHPRGGEDGQATVMLSISTPKPTPRSPLTRALQTDDETQISRIRVLVFERVGDSYLFRYHVSGTEVSSAGGQQTRFKVVLRAAEYPMKLMILANSAADAFLASPEGYGTPETTVRQGLSIDFTDTGMTCDLPMYGEVLLPDGLRASSTNSFSATVLRAVARVDVEKNLGPDSGEFILEEVYAFRACNKIQIVPNNLLLPYTSPAVDAPSIPVSSAMLAAPVVKTSPDAAAITGLYIPESAAATHHADKLDGTVVVVVGGRYGGADNPITYYRADFDSGVTGHPFGQVLRNYKYIFSIKRVNSVGYETAQLAADNLSSSMQIEVKRWEDFSAEMYWNYDSFAISSRKASMPFVAKRTRRLDVESTLEYSIQWLSGGDATSALNTTVSGSLFDARIVRDPVDPTEVTHIALRTRGDNYGTTTPSDTLLLRAGLWSVKIAVVQENPSLYSSNSFDILTVNTVGNFGTTGDPATASGLAMRWLLDVQFSPTGMVKIAGFNYGRIANSTSYIGATPTRVAAWANIQLLIARHDVIYLPYTVAISADVASLVLAWLAADTRHVLIVGTDTAGTNANLLSSLTEDGTWVFTGVATMSTSFTRGAGSVAAEPFFNGPFGSVSANALINRADAAAGYTTTRGPGMIPLIVGDKNSEAVFFGINPGRRVIYNGDAQLFQTNQMSNNNGNVNTDMDRLMANLWAWITAQVIYGDDVYEFES